MGLGLSGTVQSTRRISPSPSLWTAEPRGKGGYVVPLAIVFAMAGAVALLLNSAEETEKKKATSKNPPEIKVVGESQ